MPSPFPGMNPYIEHEDPWHTFHENLCTACAVSLAPQVEPKYIVQSDENVYVHELSGDERRLIGRPDAYVARSETEDSPRPAGAATIAPPAYALLAPAVDVEKDSFLVVRDRMTRELITVVEILSPTNKRPGPDREQYLAKRRHYPAGHVNLVEIDLLRGWPRMPFEELPDGDYCVVVSRVEERPRVAVWPIRLRDRLPVVPVPLRPPEPDAQLDLQELLHQVYDGLRLKNYIYRNQPQPPLHPDDAAWARQFVPTPS